MSDGIFTSFRVSSSALRAQRIRLDTVAENMANAETTRSPEGGPYRPQRAVFSASKGGLLDVRRNPELRFREMLTRHERHFSVSREGKGLGERVGRNLQVSVEDKRDLFISEYDPGHPDADEDGMVLKPNVDPVEEMMNLMSATRAYEANASVLDAAKEMLNRALEI